MEIKIRNKDLFEENRRKNPYPKYVTQLINLANFNAKATIPKKVGQLSELFKECNCKSFEEWKNYYLQRYPKAIDNATKRIMEMLKKLSQAMNDIDESLVRLWVEDLILFKTFIGLNIQVLIIKKLASILNKSYKLSTPEEEAKGIDGFIDNIPISIKPYSYKSKKTLPENIEVRIVFYKKYKNGIKINVDQLLDVFPSLNKLNLNIR